MRKFVRICIFFIGFFILSLLFSSKTFAFSGNGSGTSADPYQITTCSQIQEILNDLTAYYQQMNNIDCTGTTFGPIGNTSNFFMGTYDGQNYTVSNVTINTGLVPRYAGFFGVTSDGAVLKNIHLINGSVSAARGSSFVGGLVGYTYSATTISHCSSNLSITGKSNQTVGGLVGKGTSGATGDTGLDIEASDYSGTVNETSSTAIFGGIIGTADSETITINNSYASGNWTLYTSSYAGGLVGSVTSTVAISNSYSSGSITFTSGSTFGGLIDNFSAGTVSNSFSAVTIVSPASTTIYGLYDIGSGTSTNTYFDQYLVGTSTCEGSGTAGCNAVNSGNSNPNYFKGNNSNAPLSSWDFNTIWQANSGDYPTLHPSGYTAPMSNNTSSSSASTPTCSAAVPTNAPTLFHLTAKGSSATLYFVPVAGQNSSYVISYGTSISADSFATGFNYSDRSGVIPYSINFLYPGTWYFKVRGQNGCMPGNWSQVMKVQIRKA